MDLTFLHADFVAETTPLAAEVEAMLLALEGALEREGEPAPLWRRLLNALHTIKGNCGIVGFAAAQSLAHAMEERAKRAQSAPVAVQLATARALFGAADALRDAMPTPATADDRLRERASRARRRTGDDRREEPVGSRPPARVGVCFLRGRSRRRRANRRRQARPLARARRRAGHAPQSGRRRRPQLLAARRFLRRRGRSGERRPRPAGKDDRRVSRGDHASEASPAHRGDQPVSAARSRSLRLHREARRLRGARRRDGRGQGDRGRDRRAAPPLAAERGRPRPRAPRRAHRAPWKGAEATISLRIRQQGGELFLAVRDDGRGISRSKLVARARRSAES